MLSFMFDSTIVLLELGLNNLTPARHARPACAMCKYALAWRGTRHHAHAYS